MQAEPQNTGFDANNPEHVRLINEAHKKLAGEPSEFDGESISNHGAPAVLEPLPQNSIPAGILAQLGKIRAMENDRKNRQRAAKVKLDKNRKAAKAAKAARKKSR